MTGIRIKPNLRMSENLAYLIGALKGDGNISSEKKYLNVTIYRLTGKKYYMAMHGITLTTENNIFGYNIKKAMKAIGLNASISIRDNLYVVGSTSKLFCDWLRSLSYKNLGILLEQNRKYVLSFLRGYFEANGCYYYETGVKQPYVAITSGKEEIGYFVFDLISNLGFYVKLYKIKRGKTAFKKGYFYNVLIRKRNEAKKFVDMIQPCFKNEPSNKWFE